MTHKKILMALASVLLASSALSAQGLRLNEAEYFEQRGFNVLVNSNNYAGIFADEKKAGVELILRGVRVATGGGVRLTDTPEQWDFYPKLIDRKVNFDAQTITAVLGYEDYDINHSITVTPKGRGVVLSVSLDKPLPEFLVGKAGLNLEFFPATYFGKTYMMDGQGEILPRYAAGDSYMRPNDQRVPQFYGLSTFDDRGRDEHVVPLPLSKGRNFVIAPEDDNLKVAVSSDSELALFDGRLLSQNGTFVLRTLLPAGKTGKVVEWYIEAAYDPEWVREPNVGFSQIGYTPAQKKVAVIELDKNDDLEKTAKIVKILANGDKKVAAEPEVKMWGEFYGRYNYAQVDFSDVKEPGVYYIEYADVKTNSFPINTNVYEGKWHTTMDVWLPVQMDHMTVNEGYRVWHGNSHVDDAIQAPLNYEQFDGYSQGDRTNTKYKPYEHIPNLAVGAWYDAGDFDIQAGTVIGLTHEFSTLWETFRPERDQTYIDQKTQYVDIHRPDGVPDVIQQIQHGSLNVNAQVENIGFVAQGIIQSNMHQYHHLGDALTLTDNLVYDPTLKPYESRDNAYSGTLDDRYAFTGNFSPAGTMSTISALAAAARVLEPYYPEEAARSLKNAKMLWEKYHKDADPKKNTRGWGGGGRTDAAIQLWITTGDKKYVKFFEDEVLSQLEPRPVATEGTGGFRRGGANLRTALALYPYMDADFQAKVKAAIPAQVEAIRKVAEQTPYGVPVAGSGWGGNEQIISWAYQNYQIWKLFPDMIDPELVLNGLHFIYGCHPYSNVSFITAVGVNTKKVAYGNNRADHTFIPGGIVPGLLLLNPDFMEHKDDYPFHWGENECCTRNVPAFVSLSIACEEIAASMNK